MKHGQHSTLNALWADQNALRTDIERNNTEAVKRGVVQNRWINGFGIAVVTIVLSAITIILQIMTKSS